MLEIWNDQIWKWINLRLLDNRENDGTRAYWDWPSRDNPRIQSDRSLRIPMGCGPEVLVYMYVCIYVLEVSISQTVQNSRLEFIAYLNNQLNQTLQFYFCS